MGFLGISLKSAKLGAGRAILSRMNEKREDALRRQQQTEARENFLFEENLRNDYAIKAEQRAYDAAVNRAREEGKIKTEQEAEEWRLGIERATGMSTPDRPVMYIGNGNYKVLDPKDADVPFATRLQQARDLTQAYSPNLQQGQVFVPKGEGFELIGKPTNQPNVYGTMQGVAGAPSGKGIRIFRGESSSAEVNPAFESPIFEMGDGGIGKVIFGDPSVLQKEKVPYYNANLLMSTLLETDLDFHINRYKAAKNGQQVTGGDLFGYTKQFFSRNAPSILEGLKGARSSEGITTIPNPMIRFNLTEYAKQGVQEAEHAKFIATEIIAPALTIQKDLALQALNLPSETPVYTDSEFNLIIDTDFGLKLEPYTVTTTDTATGETRKTLVPELKDLAKNIAIKSGRPVGEVLSHAVESSSDPIGQLRQIEAVTPQLQSTVKQAGFEKVRVNDNVFLKNGVLSVIKNSPNASTAISTIRSMIPSAPAREMTEMVASPEGGKKPIWNVTVKNYSGIDIEGARQRADSANQARKTIGTILELQEKLGARTDPIALLELKIAGGLEAFGVVSGLLDNFSSALDSSIIQGEVGSEEYKRNKQAREETLNEISNLQKSLSRGGRIEANALARMLSLQLGYFMAGAVQGGGSTGRNISDFDVRQNINALGIDSFATLTAKRTNLLYLYDEMDQSYAIYDSYASSAGDIAQWQATQIYDDLMRGTHPDVGSLLSRAGAITEKEAEAIRSRVFRVSPLDGGLTSPDTVESIFGKQ